MPLRSMKSTLAPRAEGIEWAEAPVRPGQSRVCVGDVRPPAGVGYLFHDIKELVLLPVAHVCRAHDRDAAVTVGQSSDQLKRPGSAKWVDCERRI